MIGKENSNNTAESGMLKIIWKITDKWIKMVTVMKPITKINELLDIWTVFRVKYVKDKICCVCLWKAWNDQEKLVCRYGWSQVIA